MYNFYETNWHICQYKDYNRKDRDYLTCHMQDHKKSYYDRQWEHDSLKETLALKNHLTAKEKEEEEKKNDEGKGTASAAGAGTEGPVTRSKKSSYEAKNKHKTEEEKADQKRHAIEQKRPTQYKTREEGFTSIKIHLHWGWVTKIKFYEDLNMVLSSSLDGFIHMHELETLNYREKRTFNLH